MPADSYGFKPAPEELSFSQIVIQVAGANLNACANAGGVKRPDVPTQIADAVSGKSDADKDSIIQFLSSSFDFCNHVVASMTPEKLDSTVGPQTAE